MQQVGIFERQAGLCRDRFQQAHVGAGVGFLRPLGAKRNKAQQLVPDGKRQQQFRLQRGQFTTLLIADGLLAIHPGVAIVQEDPGGFLLALQDHGGPRLAGELDRGKTGVSHSKGRLVEAAPAQENRHLRYVQSLRDAASHGFEKRTGLDDRPHLLAQLRQYMFGVVVLAEKAAIDPGAQAIAKPADGEVRP